MDHRQITIYFLSHLGIKPFSIPVDKCPLPFDDIAARLVHGNSFPGPGGNASMEFLAIQSIGAFRVSEISRVLLEDIPSPVEQLVELVGEGLVDKGECCE